MKIASAESPRVKQQVEELLRHKWVRIGESITSRPTSPYRRHRIVELADAGWARANELALAGSGVVDSFEALLLRIWAGQLPVIVQVHDTDAGEAGDV